VAAREPYVSWAFIPKQWPSGQLGAPWSTRSGGSPMVPNRCANRGWFTLLALGAALVLVLLVAAAAPGSFGHLPSVSS
jgi:hypothetical protein